MIESGEEETSVKWLQHWDKQEFQICKISHKITVEKKYSSMIWTSCLKKIILMTYKNINNFPVISSFQAKINKLIHINKLRTMRFKCQWNMTIKLQFFWLILLKMLRKMEIILTLINIAKKIKIWNSKIFKRSNLMKGH